MPKAVPYSASSLYTKRGQRRFTGKRSLQISFPLGGIGAGCIGLNGQGGLQDFAIRNRPAFSAAAAGGPPAEAAFALLRIMGGGPARLVEGPLPPEKIYNLGLKAQGGLGGGYEGLPRFRNCVFKGEYPFGVVELSDEALPLAVRITGFNPFIPLDEKNSGIPGAILEYRLENRSSTRVQYQFSYHLSHLAPGGDVRSARTSRNTAIPGIGIFFYNEEPPNSEDFGSAALGVVGYEPLIKAMWFRGGWFDAISMLWKEVSSGEFQPDGGRRETSPTGRNGGSLLLAGSLEPGEAITYPIVITWFFPNAYATAGVLDSGKLQGTCGCSNHDCRETIPPWRPYYASQWQDAQDVLLYVRDNYDLLRQRTQAFHAALFSSTLPAYVLDAVSANLAILKSPTVLRQENGALWGWEGCRLDRGCCHGSCTHVWNYAQAIPHLFPALERTLREGELERSMDPTGHVNFRAALPAGPTDHTFQAAADGQLGGILKVYREWQISGNREWLGKMVPLAKKSLDYCIATWDPRHNGILEEPHHTTYDIEFWGPDGMCTSFYLGALAAMAALLQDCGRAEEAQFYQDLAQKGAAYLDRHLFNGEYYQQAVTTQGLRDTSFSKLVAGSTGQGGPEESLLREEGPKYQYGSGCLSDGVLGCWLALVCGVGSPQNQAHVRRHLQAVFEYNFKATLWEHANPQRAGFALGDEPGLLLCTWPRGRKPALPFVYSDEVWTGIEYQAAAHMIAAGLVDEGLTIVKAARSRYDGFVRNPWNEYECGSYYARAMSSYALLSALAGFHYSAVTKTLSFGPKLKPFNFKVFFSTASGYGTISLHRDVLKIIMLEGELRVNVLLLRLNGKTIRVEPQVVARAGKALSIKVPLAGLPG